MKPLFQTFFCDVNECDLPEGKRRKQPEWKAAVTVTGRLTWTGMPGDAKLLNPGTSAYCDCPKRFATMYHQGRVICLSCNLEVAKP